MRENTKQERVAIIQRYEAAKDSLKLSPREIQIFELRFGITDGIPKTLEETARVFGITRERIRQIEAHMLDKIGIAAA